MFLMNFEIDMPFGCHKKNVWSFKLSCRCDACLLFWREYYHLSSGIFEVFQFYVWILECISVSFVYLFQLISIVHFNNVTCFKFETIIYLESRLSNGRVFLFAFESYHTINKIIGHQDADNL